MERRLLQRKEYTVGWICALPVELTAALEMLDETHQDLPAIGKDSNTYSLGSIGKHNIVLVCLPAGQMGTNAAATIATQLNTTFPNIRFWLMVGIGGGVPSKDADVRLGDIVVSTPGNGHGGVVQYDFGRTRPDAFERTGFLNSPPPILLTAISKLRSNLDRDQDRLLPHLTKLNRLPKFTREAAGPDVLFKPEYLHVGGSSCEPCAAAQQVQRKERASLTPVVHHGTIASGNQVMRDARLRDKISAEFGGVLCFEMEAAGLMNSFPCAVIRGICDYSDSHKNKGWQPYAAGIAAAYAKELLTVIHTSNLSRTGTFEEGRKEYLPFTQNQRFVGRNTELDVLEEKLFKNKDCHQLALVGLGGVGKTQIALQFAYYVKERYPDYSIFWVQAMSMETFEQAYADVAIALGIQDPTEAKVDVKPAVQKHLSSKSSGKWLLIVDNADDMEILTGKQQQGLLDFLPRSDDGLILFTTRHSRVAYDIAGPDVVQVAKMGTNEGKDMLQRLLPKKLLRDDAEVQNLLTELDHLPLAITQAAAFINSNRSSITEYLRLLNGTEQDAVILMSTEFRDNTGFQNSANNTIAKTWTISFNQINEMDDVAAHLLAFISHIEWKAIPYSILPIFEPEARMAKAIGTLCSYSFLERRQHGDLFDMHRLVHLATKNWIRQNGKQEQSRDDAMAHLANIFPMGEWLHRPIWQSYMPHVAHINSNEPRDDTYDQSELCLKIGWCLYKDGKTREAIRWMERSCDWRDFYMEDTHPDRLRSQYSLAVAFLENAQAADSIQLLKNVVKAETKALPDDHPERLASLHQLARAYLTNDQFKKCIKLVKWIIAKEATITTDHWLRPLTWHHTLASAYISVGQVDKAIEILEHIIAVESGTVNDDHPDRLDSMHELARAYHKNGQVDEAIALFERVIAISAEVFAPDNPYLLISKHELARAYHTNGQYKLAHTLLSEVIDADTLPKSHPDHMDSERLLDKYARDLRANGDVGETWVDWRKRNPPLPKMAFEPMSPSTASPHVQYYDSDDDDDDDSEGGRPAAPNPAYLSPPQSSYRSRSRSSQDSSRASHGSSKRDEHSSRRKRSSARSDRSPPASPSRKRSPRTSATSSPHRKRSPRTSATSSPHRKRSHGDAGTSPSRRRSEAIRTSSQQRDPHTSSRQRSSANRSSKMTNPHLYSEGRRRRETYQAGTYQAGVPPRTKMAEGSAASRRDQGKEGGRGEAYGTGEAYERSRTYAPERYGRREGYQSERRRGGDRDEERYRGRREGYGEASASASGLGVRRRLVERFRGLLLD
ncbi:hypothetical protein IQ07DRAFT_576125 [Pyrenochaeta sp. DS3sAY3a]|nr:hypothetical protein IQ07DRAFT_576125 [Pyrenochaeta sp. DS3sAY3a]